MAMHWGGDRASRAPESHPEIDGKVVQHEVLDPVAVYGPLLAPSIVTLYSIIDSCVDNNDRECLVRLLTEFEHMRKELEGRRSESIPQPPVDIPSWRSDGPATPVWRYNACGCITYRWHDICPVHLGQVTEGQVLAE